MKHCQLDHLVVAAPRLEVGAEWIRRTLGVELQAGGRHPRMGTHNLLLKLGETSYLEVISPDPDAAAPNRPRWFELDHLEPSAPARLATWVARTESIEAARAACAEALGDIETMRRGDLTWRITIPGDGRLVLGGAAPSLIQWQTPVHPAEKLPDQGCSLERLEIEHPDPARVEQCLAAVGFVGSVLVRQRPEPSPPELTAHILTPERLRTLGPSGSD